jgi:pantoate kinase
MEAVRRRPGLRTFLDEARHFSEAVGFQTPKVSGLIEAMISAGAIGATQNMLGEAVHGVIPEEKAVRALKKLRKAFPSARIFLSWLDDRGVRFVEPRNPKH